MLHYILQTIAFQLFFLIIYDVFLKKETFFNWNRAYLLGTAIVSIVLPFIKIQSFKNVVPKDFVMVMPEAIIGNIPNADAVQTVEITTAEASKFQSPWELLFYIGAAVALVIFMIKLIKIISLIYKNPKYWNQNLRIVTLLKSNTAFSFFYYVFLGEYIKTADKPTILKHEAVHVNQHHTLDLLLFELFRIVFWFNPLIYMYQNRMASLHEFIADAEAVKSQNKNDYYQDLLSQIFETEKVSFINTFYKKSLIKKRIVMLSRTKSKQVQLIKYALLIPLVFGMLLYTSSYAQDKTEVETVKENKATQELSDYELENMYYQQLVDLSKKDSEVGKGIIQEYILKNEGYIVTRKEHFKARALLRFLKEMRIKHLKEDGNYKEEDSKTFANLLGKNKTYAGYLKWKKSEEGKRAWDNQTKDGVLRLVVNDISSLSDKESALMEKKMKMIDNDDYFKELLMVDLSGNSKTITPEVLNLKHSQKPKTNTKPIKQTQIQDPIEVPFATIEEIPVLPSCESLTTQKERRNCVAQKISQHVQDNFNVKLAENSGLKGKQRISVIFRIDTNGNVVNVRARAPNPDLEAEAIRVIKTLPQFTPGKQKGQIVNVPYALPIIFEVKDGSNVKLSYLQKANLRSAVKTKKQELREVPFAVIDEVPVYPGCETITGNEERRKCMAELISKFVQQKFNLDVAKQSGLKGEQRIAVIFKIDTLGNVIGIRSRAANKPLENEAKRVIGLLPKMIPGKQKGQKVVVPYSLPILFKVAENSSELNKGINAEKGTKIEESIKDLKNQLKNRTNENGLPFAIVDKVPTLPECEHLSTNKSQRKCVSDAIIKVVQKNFNTDLAGKLGLKGKRQIMVVFQINKQGNIKNIRARGPHPDLEAEAIRTVKLLPKFVPGEDKGKKISVSYSLPIVFMVK